MMIAPHPPALGGLNDEAVSYPPAAGVGWRCGSGAAGGRRGAALWINRGPSGPGAVAISYSQALDRHDLAAANALLSKQSRPLDLTTPAEQLGGPCTDPTVAKSEVTGTVAMVLLSCANRSSGPSYPMVQEDGAWKVFTIGVR